MCAAETKTTEKTVEREQTDKNYKPFADRERLEESYNKAFHRAEDAMSVIQENNRRIMQTMFAFQKFWMNTSIDYANKMRDEAHRAMQVISEQSQQSHRQHLTNYQESVSQLISEAEKTMHSTSSTLEDSTKKVMDYATPKSR